MTSPPDFESLLKEAQFQLSLNPEAARFKAQNLLEIQRDARAIRLIAQAERRLGNASEADAAELAALRISNRDPQLRAAMLANEQCRWSEGATIAREHLETSNDDPVALTVLAEALIGMRRSAEAEIYARQASGNIPKYIRARLALSDSLVMQCRMAEAIQVLDEGLNETPDSPEILEVLAEVLAACRRFDRAIEAHRRVVDLESENSRAWLNYALTLRFAGQAARAEQALRRSIALDPSHGPSWWALANMALESITDTDVEAMAKAVERARDSRDASHLHLALATVLDRAGDHDLAYRNFSAGKAILAQKSRYDAVRFAADNDVAIERFDAQFFKERSDFGTDSRAPIFIVGLPRSGSTLVERILGCHPMVEAAGELPIIPALLDQLIAEADHGLGYPALLSRMSKARSRELGESYVARARDFRITDKPLWTDKLHLNWLHLPFIRLILPNARIIDVRRSAMDCCWSNFKILFASGHPASDDLANIGHFYCEYVRMMDSAQSSGAQVLPIRYEAVVDDLEAEMRHIVDFLGLEFEPSCLDFHRLDGPVATISCEQVRKPLNREGIGRWKPYRQWLGPLFKALGPLAPDEA